MFRANDTILISIKNLALLFIPFNFNACSSMYKHVAFSIFASDSNFNYFLVKEREKGMIRQQARMAMEGERIGMRTRKEESSKGH